MAEGTAVEAIDIVKQFGQGDHVVRALDHVSVAIKTGEFFTLLGPSGCGKTTLLRLIAGFEAPSAGQIVLEGADVTALAPNQRPVNTVFQSYALFPHLSVAQNVSFGLEMLGRPRAEITATTERMLALVRMETLANRKTSQLSGGQQQRVALARALAPQPKVLLLDEPLSALDLQLREEMQGELKRLQRETGITFIFVTHDQEEALTMSDRIAVMRAGHILQVGSPREIYTEPTNRFVASFIGETNFLKGTMVDDTQVALPGGEVLAVAFGAQPAGTQAAGTQAAGMHAGQHVDLAIRPEQIRILPANSPDTIAGIVSGSVYFGTDTHCNITLNGTEGAQIVVRLQSPVSGSAGLDVGASVGVAFNPGALRVIGA